MIDLSLYLVYYLSEPIEFNILGKQHQYINKSCNEYGLFFFPIRRKHPTNTICPSDLANYGPWKLGFSGSFLSSHLDISSQRSTLKEMNMSCTIQNTCLCKVLL